MSALVKELLLDIKKLPIDMRCDLLSAIESLYIERLITWRELLYLDMFSSGYTAEEIALKHTSTTEHIQEILTRITQAIETRSGYLDADFVYKVEKSGKYSQHKIGKLVEFLKQQSATY